MKEEINTTESIAERCHVTDAAVRRRAKNLGIRPVRNGHQFEYTDDQADRIVNYHRKEYYGNKIKAKIRFAIVELFLTMKENSCKNISEASNISMSTVNYVINDYLKNGKTILIESKMNYLTD